ncbi:ninjurin-1-like [Hyalella azteca]|uniref:Ninjurin-1-like n=1 Tax=Hyalella azteca TaxID=294128 RepID=A0A8B7N9T1_HYAAZ|nr:ninjurin-1-like [Hyalella azteca]
MLNNSISNQNPDMVLTHRGAKMSGTTAIPLADLRETYLDAGLDEGFTNNMGGVDDGLAEEGGHNDPGFGPPTAGGDRPSSPGTRDDGTSRRRGYFPVHNPANEPDVPINKGRRPLDVNLYATKKTVAQGMMDLALLTANANQLRYVLESGSVGGLYYNLNVSLICISIIFQVVIGVALIFLGRYDVSHELHARKADILNNWIVLGVFLITVVNVFISAFGIEPLDGLNPELVRAAVETAAEANPRQILG